MDIKIKEHVRSFIVLCRSYIIWICVHYTCSHLYVYFCTPKTPIGFITSPFLHLTPQCKTVLVIGLFACFDSKYVGNFYIMGNIQMHK